MNKKGMTLVEIIISIVLISIVLIFLFSLLITVKDINDESEVNSTYLINKSLILKNLEEDFDKATSVKLSECDAVTGISYKVSAIYSQYGVGDYFKDKEGNDLGDKYKANNCIKFIYDDEEDNVGYLGIYYYKNKESYVISYIHDDVKATRLLPDFENTASIDNSNNLKTWTHAFSSDKMDINDSYLESITNPMSGFNIITIPIIGPDNKDYSINISYYK